MIELNKKHILPVSDAVAMTVVCLLHVSLGVSVSTAGLTGRLDLNLSKIYMATTNDQAVIYLFKANNGNTRTMCVCLKLTSKAPEQRLQPLNTSEKQRISDISNGEWTSLCFYC